MKRVLVMLMILLLLTGCSGKEPVPVEAEGALVAQEELPAPETEQVPTPEPEPAPEPERGPEADPKPVVKPEPEREPEPAVEPETEENLNTELIPAWEAFAANAYKTITGREEFRILIGKDGAETELTFHQTLDEMSPVYVANSFADYDWTLADSADWIAMLQAEDAMQLSFSLPGELSFTCRENGNIVEIADQTKITYLKAERRNAEDASVEQNLYHLLKLTPEDFAARKIWDVTVDGSVSEKEAAGRMAEKIAENYRSVPDWVSWKAESVKAERAEVFDIYYGTPEQFCFNLGLAVKVADPMAAEAGYWQAGSGLEEPDEDGFYGWNVQVWVRRDEAGAWSLEGWGSGGVAVLPEKPEEKPELDWLAEVFCLTEGFSHDWVVPNQMLNLDPEVLAELPAVLDQLTEAESRDLCETLGKLLDENDCWILEKEDLIPLLGEYALYLTE
jgi:hypothetical protein